MKNKKSNNISQAKAYYTLGFFQKSELSYNVINIPHSLCLCEKTLQNEIYQILLERQHNKMKAEIMHSQCWFNQKNTMWLGQYINIQAVSGWNYA